MSLINDALRRASQQKPGVRTAFSRRRPTAAGGLQKESQPLALVTAHSSFDHAFVGCPGGFFGRRARPPPQDLRHRTPWALMRPQSSHLRRKGVTG
jgi:hypothetical protein